MRSRDLPGIRTERFARPPGTQELVFDDHIAWDTPEFRSTWWGHAVIPDAPPAELDSWRARWHGLHGHAPVGRAMVAWEHRVPTALELPAGAEREVISTLMCDQPIDAIPGPATIRALQPEDAPALDALASALGEEPVSMGWAIRGWLARSAAGTGHLWGAVLDDQLAAVAGLFTDDREARTQWIATHPDHRRKGLCTQLLTHAVAHHQDRHPGIVYTGTTRDSDAERLYRSLGWRRVTVLECVTFPPHHPG